MIINVNMQAVITNSSLWNKNRSLQKNSKNLSLGTKINTAGDDPAGMAISNKMKSQIAGLEIADRNTNDAISLIQTAEGALAEVQNMVQRMRELAIQGATDTVTDEDRKLIQQEIDQLVEEIDSVSERVEFNERTLLNDKYGSLIFQVGEKEGMELTFDLKNMNSESLGLSTLNGTVKDNIKYLTVQDCEKAIETCDNAISKISEFRSELGATQNRLEKNSSSLIVSTENSKIALSRIIDTDMAYEMAEYTKNNVLVQSSLAMLAQANQRPNQLLSLLQ
ncbi:MAG: flagellin [Eubacteriales bacterium]|nr:flagellin [Eubacteriales bacterium]